MQFYVGEALVGDGNEVSHIDLMIGSKDSPVGAAFANALSTQSEGHTNLLAVLEPNGWKASPGSGLVFGVGER